MRCDPGARPLRRLLASLVAATAIVMLASGCGDDANAHSADDVEYASHLISHHAQTLQLLDLALGREEVSDEAGALADQIRAKGWDEVGIARKWLKSRGEEIPKTALEHTHSDEPVHYDTSIPGMVTRQQMLSVQNSSPRTFQRSWLQALIDHEEGGAELAAEAAKSAQNQELAVFAEQDTATHRKQVERLTQLLKQSS